MSAGHENPTGWRRWLLSTNHKDIGTLYLILAIIGGLVTATLATLTLLPVLYWLWLRRQAAQKMA